MKNNKEEIKIVDIQLIAILLTIVSSIISLLLTINQKLELKNLKTLFTTKQTFKITKFNRTLILILGLIFLYVNYRLYQISKNQKEDLKPYELQISASILTVIAALIALYVVSLSTKENVADIENPIV